MFEKALLKFGVFLSPALAHTWLPLDSVNAAPQEQGKAGLFVVDLFFSLV